MNFLTPNEDMSFFYPLQGKSKWPRNGLEQPFAWLTVESRPTSLESPHSSRNLIKATVKYTTPRRQKLAAMSYSCKYGTILVYPIPKVRRARYESVIKDHTNEFTSYNPKCRKPWKNSLKSLQTIHFIMHNPRVWCLINEGVVVEQSTISGCPFT